MELRNLSFAGESQFRSLPSILVKAAILVQGMPRACGFVPAGIQRTSYPTRQEPRPPIPPSVGPAPAQNVAICHFFFLLTYWFDILRFRPKSTAYRPRRGANVAKIVYGVSGEGSGHSSRSREMATHLQRQGHDLWMVSYDRGYRNLKDDFRVFETEGLTIASEDNQVSIVRTFTENLMRLPEGHRKLQQLKNELFKGFQPDVVITDFEPMTAYLASHYDIPLISIDNQHRMRYMDFDCPPGSEADRHVTKTIIRAMVPRPDVSLVITFVQGPTTNDRTFLFPPILRRAVLDKTPTRGDHILVYVTSGYESLLEQLQEFDREKFLVYGYDRSDSEGPCQFRPFSRDGFLSDLAGAKAVIATAGFTLISEALYLRKPYCRAADGRSVRTGVKLVHAGWTRLRERCCGVG